MSQLSLEDICLSFCRDTALEILALRQQGGGFLPCLTTKILRIYSSRFNWYINSDSIFHLPLLGTIKTKPVPKRKIALRRVLYNTRGTTQIADIKIRHLFEVYQLLCTNAAFTGTIYWVFKPLGVPAQKGEVQVPGITDSHQPSVL